MSKKRELVNVIQSYKDKQEVFKNKVTEICRNTDLSQEGAEKGVNELAAPFESVAQNVHDKAIKLLDDGILALKDKWRNNTAGKLLDSNYQIGLANTIKMIEAGAISSKEDFKNIIEVYKDDYNALSTIRNILGTGTNKLELLMLIPEDTREYNMKLLNDLRNNIDSYINPFSIRDLLSMSLDNMVHFINTRLKDDFTVIPWEEVQ